MARTGSSNSGVMLLGLAAVGYLAWRKIIVPRVIIPAHLAAYVPRLRVNLPAVRIKGDNVELDLYIQNPNPDPITISAIVGDVFVDTPGRQYKLGNLAKYGNTVLKPAAETKMTLSIRQRFLGFLPYFTDMVKGKITHQVARFTGTITVNGRPYPVTEQYRIS